ncbi:MAG: hypothetical protein LBD58_10615, partial [Treponema sp.]|nr:hypothetical protein [Treponema sp.]
MHIKDKKNRREPDCSETFSVIRENVIKAIMDIENKEKQRLMNHVYLGWKHAIILYLRNRRKYHGRGRFLRTRRVG